MKVKKSGFFQSTIVRIVFVIIVLVLPVNILTLIMSQTIVRNNRNQIYREIENTLEISASSMQSQILSSYRRIVLLNSNNTDFRVLEYLSEDMSQMESNNSYYRAKDELDNACTEASMVDAMYFYFQKQGKSIVSGNAGLQTTVLSDFIIGLSEESAENNPVWKVLTLNGESLLVSHMVWNSADFGLIINLDYAIGRLSFETEEGRSVFFRNEEETIFSDSGEKLFEQKGMTLDEMRMSADYIVLETEITGYDLVLVEVLETGGVWQSLPHTVIVLEFIAITMSLIVIPLLLWYTNRNVSRPLRRLTSAIERIEGGELDYRIEQTGEGGQEFRQVIQNFNDMMDQVKKLKIDAYEMELGKKDIQMQYLSHQIQPHFILNTLNILYSFEPEEYEYSQQMILRLSRYFRYIVRANSKYVELKYEMDHVRNYFEIQRMRYLDDFFYKVEYDAEIAEAMIPVLLIENFAENAIKYSFKPGQKGFVSVTAYVDKKTEKKRMHIRIADAGEGLTDEILDKIRRFQDTGEIQDGLGVGITNSIERLKYLYSEELTNIQFGRDSVHGGTVVEISLPVFFRGKIG